MALRVGTAFSKNTDPKRAGIEAVEQALKKARLEPGETSLAVVFSSVALDQEKLLAGVNAALGGAPVIGCSTAGEITDSGVHEESVIALVMQSSAITFSPGCASGVKKDARAAGKTFAEAIMSKDPNVRAIMMMPDVLAGSGSSMVEGVLSVVGEHFIIVGGAPGDDYQFKQTYQYADKELLSGGITGTGLSGKFAMGVGVRHGWIPVGEAQEVTKADGAVLHELNHKPAVAIYEDYLGKQAEELKSEPLARLAIVYPLGIVSATNAGDEYLIRDPITVNDDGSITLAAEIKKGEKVKLMVGSPEESIKAAKVSAQKMMDGLDGKKPEAVFMFNCIARKKLYGIKEKHEEEIRAVQSIIGAETPLVGFYTYGEQAPLGGEIKNLKQCNPKFHNETMVLFGIAE